MRRGVRLGVDVGKVRIGVAGCDPDGLLASPLATVARGRGDLAELAGYAAERRAVEVIVGLPTGLSGREGASAADARQFAAALAQRVTPLPVRLLDERFTTVLAHDALRRGGRDGRARRTVVDQAAAALLLQGALDTERSTGRPAGELVAPPSPDPAPDGASGSGQQSNEQSNGQPSNGQRGAGPQTNGPEGAG